MNQRIIPWGTVIAGAIALGTAVLIGLAEIADVSVPIGSAGPGAVIVIGILILVTGLVVVLRSNRAGRTGDSRFGAATPPQPAATAPNAAGATPSEVRSETSSETSSKASSEALSPVEDSSPALDGTDIEARQSSH